MKIFTSNLSAILTLFICIVIGYVFGKKNLVSKDTNVSLSKLESHLFIPALTLHTFLKNCTIESIKAHADLVFWGSVLVILSVGIAYFVSMFFTKDEYKRGIYKYSLLVGNFGFMGNSVVLMMYDDVALYRYMLFTLPVCAVVYSWGLYNLIPKENAKGNFLKNIFNPMFVSVILGALIGITGIGRKMPDFFISALSTLGACMGPVAMILTGLTIAKFNLLDLLKNKGVYILTFIRLIVIPFVFIMMLKYFGVSKEVLVFSVFVFATPLGLNTVVIPTSYRKDASLGAQMAAVSHTICVITIPLMYVLSLS